MKGTWVVNQLKAHPLSKVLVFILVVSDVCVKSCVAPYSAGAFPAARHRVAVRNPAKLGRADALPRLSDCCYVGVFFFCFAFVHYCAASGAPESIRVADFFYA